MRTTRTSRRSGCSSPSRRASSGATCGRTAIEYEPMPISSSATANPPMSTSPVRIWRQYSLHWFVSKPGPSIGGTGSVTRTCSRMGVSACRTHGTSAGVQALVASSTDPAATSPWLVRTPATRPERTSSSSTRTPVTTRAPRAWAASSSPVHEAERVHLAVAGRPFRGADLRRVERRLAGHRARRARGSPPPAPPRPGGRPCAARGAPRPR